MRATPSRRMPARRFDEIEPVLHMDRTVSFFAQASLCEGLRISFSFSQPVGKA